jgi:hypothetical protein
MTTADIDQAATEGPVAAENRVRDARTREIELRTALRACETEEAISAMEDLAGMVRSEFGGLPARVTRDLVLRRMIDKELSVTFNRISARLQAEAEVLQTGKREAAKPDLNMCRRHERSIPSRPRAPGRRRRAARASISQWPSSASHADPAGGRLSAGSPTLVSAACCWSCCSRPWLPINGPTFGVALAAPRWPSSWLPVAWLSHTSTGRYFGMLGASSTWSRDRQGYDALSRRPPLFALAGTHE